MSNKDEALRAKDLAEDWMSKSDFTTARRIAIKAQKMDATLESVVARMIMVCDVHCAALEKSGDETDWYKILQVEQTADENTIKKQYKKLALHLHPDKNKLPGAESAFKTIGEAQRVLLDKDKRRFHDMRRKPVFRRPAPAPAPAPSFQPPQQAPTTPFFTQRGFQTNVNVARKRPENQKKPQAQPTGFDGLASFTTSCAFCHRKYEYQRKLINTLMTCLNCGKQYVAFQETFQPPVQPTFSFFQQSKVPTQEAGKAVEKQPESCAKSFFSKEGSRAKSSGVSAENINGKRKRKKVVESSDSSCSESSIDCNEVPAGGQDSGSSGAQHSRRSVRSKQQVSYKEDKEEDAESAEESDFRKKSHEDQPFTETLPNGLNRTKKSKAAKNSSSGSASDAEIQCTDPDFSNFEKSREVTCFKAGQTWAIYDDMGGMPRYYAIIRKVIRQPSFMLKIQWLEAEPDDEKANLWVRKNLPISIGKFKLGGNENIEKTPCFSHMIYFKVGSMKDTVRVYPRIGETWALFKNWDINWSSGRRRSSHEHEYEYEFVEILSEYVEGVAIQVAFLRKIKGFTSVFCRIAPGGGSDTIQIPPHELLRFSHSIPSTKLTGKEGNGVPIGSYEFDTAALPQKIEQEEAVPVLRESAKLNQVNHNSPPSSEPDCIVIPNFQFNNFSAERLEGKFAPGQIWSLNSKEDGLPKCYAKIQQIVWRPVFKLQINRLEPKSLLENVIQWHDKRMPVSCGNFTLKEGRDETLTKVTDFSHQIKAEKHFRINEYIVVPKTGEIWAMYKNWSETIKATSLKRCEYEVVEVLDDNDSHIEVMLLEQVDGFISVFKEKLEGGIDVKKKIPRCELLRFSHYVPAFRLTGERDGALRGYVELDPSAFPLNLRRS
jgi:curved DNA-binding protein CbpA